MLLREAGDAAASGRSGPPRREAGGIAQGRQEPLRWAAGDAVAGRQEMLLRAALACRFAVRQEPLRREAGATAPGSRERTAAHTMSPLTCVSGHLSRVIHISAIVRGENSGKGSPRQCVCVRTTNKGVRVQRTWLSARAKTMLEMCRSVNTCSSQEHPSRLHITQSRRSPLRGVRDNRNTHTCYQCIHFSAHGGVLKDLAIMLSEESNIHAHPQTRVVTPSRTRTPLHVSQKYIIRHRGDSNPCGQSPMDFESISLTSRTQCLVVKARNIRPCTTRSCWICDSSAPMSAYVPSAPRYIFCVDATAPRTWTYTQTHTHTNKSTAWHEHDAIERQLRLSSPKRCLATGTNRNIKRAHGVVVSHPLRMRKALGSIPSGSICQDLILLPCVFAYTRGLCHNTEHQRQTLKGTNVFLEKTDTKKG